MRAAIVRSLGGGFSPPQVQNLVATVTGTTATLTWDAIPGASGYNVRQNSVFVTTAPSNSASVPGLSAGQTYSFTVSVFVGGLEGTLSRPAVVSIASGLAPPANFTMTNQEPNGASFMWTAAPGAASYRLYRATISPQGVVGGFSQVATSSSTTVRDGSAPNLATSGGQPRPYIAATGYRYAISSVSSAGAESALNYSLKAWIYGSGGKGPVPSGGPQFWSLNYDYGGNNDPANKSNLQAGSTSNWRIYNGQGCQPRSSTPFLVIPGDTNAADLGDWAETSMFNFICIDVYWFATGDAMRINPISRITTGDNFNNAVTVLGDAACAAAGMGPASQAGQWMTYKIPFVGPLGASCQLGYGSFDGSISGSNLTVTAVTPGGCDINGSAYVTGLGLTPGTLNGPGFTAYVGPTYGHAFGPATDYTVAPSGQPSVSGRFYTQRTNFYKTGLLQVGSTSQFLIDNWYLSST